MKKFITKLLKFTSVAIIAYVVLVCAWGSFVPKKLNLNLLYKVGSADYMFTRIKEIKSTKNLDILFLGSSHAYRGFDPRIFKNAGYNTFTLASSSQTPIQTQILLERYLHELSPKTVIYEIYPSTFCSDGVESALNIISNDKNDRKSLRMALEVNNIKVYNTLIYGYFSDLIKKNKYFKEKLKRPNEGYVSGGYVERSPTSNPKYDDKITREWILNPQQVEAFEKSLKLLESKNIKVILVYAPITKVRYNSYSNNDEFNKIMEKYGKVYNFNDILHLDDTNDFNDYDHLNQSGVEKFNNSFLKQIPL